MKLGKLIAIEYLKKIKTVSKINKLKPIFIQPEKDCKKVIKNVKKERENSSHEK